MPWPLRLIEYTHDDNGQTLLVGDMFYGPTKEMVEMDERLDPEDRIGWRWPYFFCKDNKLSDYYKQHNSHRPPLFVFMPGRVLFCLDSMCWNGSKYYGGWAVTGEAPHVTVHPSIDMGSLYHGWIHNGVISDDVSGAEYDVGGRCIPRAVTGVPVGP